MLSGCWLGYIAVTWDENHNIACQRNITTHQLNTGILAGHINMCTWHPQGPLVLINNLLRLCKGTPTTISIENIYYLSARFSTSANLVVFFSIQPQSGDKEPLPVFIPASFVKIFYDALQLTGLPYCMNIGYAGKDCLNSYPLTYGRSAL